MTKLIPVSAHVRRSPRKPAAFIDAMLNLMGAWLERIVETECKEDKP